MLGETSTPIFPQTMKFDADMKQAKIDELCKIVVRMNLDLLIIHKLMTKSRKGGKKSESKIIIAELEMRVENYGFMNNLAQTQPGNTFGHIALLDIYFEKNELQRILFGRIGTAVVNFAGKDRVHRVSMSRHLLVQVEINSESMMVLFDSDAISHVMSHKMMLKSYLRMKPTSNSTKVASCASEK